MKNLIKSLLLPFAMTSTLAQLVVQDPLLLAQELIKLAREGDPAAIQQLAGLAQLGQSLTTPGTGLPLSSLQKAATGASAFSYDGNGLYRPVQDRVLTPSGLLVMRSEPDYRKFDAVAQT